jgi:hypothetical protein
MLSFPIAASAQDANALKRLQDMQTSLGDAIQIVERESLGRVMRAAFVEEHNRAVWEVDALSDLGMFEYRVEAASGRLVRMGETAMRGRLYSIVPGLRLDDLGKTRISASEADSRGRERLQGKGGTH